jgi:hypothetical protein
MKYIKIKNLSTDKNKEIIKLFKHHDIKLINNHYAVEDKLFNKLKQEIDSLDLDLSVARDADYVIIKEKMNRKTPKGMPK